MAIDTELGTAATDYYIHECIEKFQRGTTDGSFVVEGFEDDERRYLKEKFSKVHIPNLGTDPLVENSVMTPKLRTLIEYLLGEDAQGFSGLIFVRTRAEVAVLSYMLTLHVPKFTISTFIGASSFSGRTKAITELAEVKNQRHTLDDLRQGKNHIVVTTNALEEGIDVTACNVVICFDPPPNLKSFIQRRGRARKSFSKFVLMFEEGPSSRAILTWEELEAEMMRIYEDDMRALEEAKALEEQEEEGRRELFNETTGYLLFESFCLIATAYLKQGKAYPGRCRSASSPLLRYATGGTIRRPQAAIYLRRAFDWARGTGQVHFSKSGSAKLCGYLPSGSL